MAHISATRKISACIAAILALLFGGAVTGGAELADIVEQVESSVVRIDTDGGIGSGVVVDAKGFIITNYHVIEGATRAKVTFRTGTVAKVTGYLAIEPKHDLALLQIEPPDTTLRPIVILEKLPRKGEKVAAFGNPKGFSFTTSEGIVSAIRAGSEMSQLVGPEVYKALGYGAGATWIQTTAAISGGNSGGPLVNMQGELVGINTLTNQSGQNLNFAIAAPDIQKVIAKSSSAVKPLAKLPRRANEVSTRGRFKLAMPSGHIFTFEAFNLELGDFRRRSRSDDQMLVLKHGNGSLFALAEHEAGVLNGRTLAFYSSKDPMIFSGYSHGLRNGLLETFTEAGEPLLFSQYLKGKRQGFSCLFDSGKLRMIVEYDRDKVKAVQLMANLEPLKTLNSEEEAEADETAHELLQKLREAEVTVKTNELALKREVTAEYKEYKRANLKRARSIR